MSPKEENGSGLHPDFANSPLLDAAEIGDEDALSRLLAAGVSVDVVSRWGDLAGMTAIMMAAATGKSGCIDILALAGSDVNHKEDFYGVTAIMLAAAAGHMGCIEALVRAGADINHVSNTGNTAIMVAASKGAVKKGCLDCIDPLLLAGAELHHATNDGKTALQLASTEAIRQRLERALASNAAMSAARARQARGRRVLKSSTAEDGIEEQARRARASEAAAKTEAELLAALEEDETERSCAARDSKPSKPHGGGGGVKKKKNKRKDRGISRGGGSGGGGVCAESQNHIEHVDTPPSSPVLGLTTKALTGTSQDAHAWAPQQPTASSFESAPPHVPASLSVHFAGDIVAERDAATAARNGAAPLCELGPPLGSFLARLGLSHHLPVLVDDGMSLASLRRLTEDDLHKNLAEIGLKRGARCGIILGLRDLSGDDDDSCASSVVASATATATSAAAPTTASSSTPQWFLDGFEDIS